MEDCSPPYEFEFNSHGKTKPDSQIENLRHGSHCPDYDKSTRIPFVLTRRKGRVDNGYQREPQSTYGSRISKSDGGAHNTVNYVSMERITCNGPNESPGYAGLQKESQLPLRSNVKLALRAIDY